MPFRIAWTAGLLKPLRPRPLLHRRQCFITTTKPLSALKATQLPPRPACPPDEEFTEAYLRGTGPGGQKINKTSSAVQLKHIPTGIVVKCQETRSRSQNRKIARQHLAEKIDNQVNGEQSRSAIVNQVNSKKKASARKKSLRKYRTGEEEPMTGSGSGREAKAKEKKDKAVHVPLWKQGAVVDSGR